MHALGRAFEKSLRFVSRTTACQTVAYSTSGDSNAQLRRHASSILKQGIRMVSATSVHSPLDVDELGVDGTTPFTAPPPQPRGWTGGLHAPGAMLECVKDDEDATARRKDEDARTRLRIARAKDVTVLFDEESIVDDEEPGNGLVVEEDCDDTYYSDDEERSDEPKVVYKDKHTRFIPIASNSFRTANKEEKMAMFKEFMRLLDDIPAAMGTEEVPYTRRVQQRKMHIPMAYAIAKIIFNQDMQSVFPWLQREYRLKPFQQKVVGVIASRQVGKTTAAAIILLAALIAFPTFDIVCASTCQRTANQTVECMKGFKTAYENRHGGVFKMEYDSVTKLVFDVSKSTCKAVPTSPDKVRGIHPDLFYFDECTHADPRMLSEVAIPLLKLPRALFLTGTPSSRMDNHYTKLIKGLWLTGPLIELVDLSLTCQSCLLQGIRNTCEHRLYLVEADGFQSIGEQYLQELIRVISDEQTALAEMQGATVEAEDAVFNAQSVQRFMEALPVTPRLEARFRPAYAILSVDPSGGSMGLGKTAETGAIGGFVVDAAEGGKGSKFVVSTRDWPQHAYDMFHLFPRYYLHSTLFTSHFTLLYCTSRFRTTRHGTT